MNAALALVQDNRSAAVAVSQYLHAEFGPLKGTTKHAARAANANERSAENWLQARVCPDVPKFLRLAMQVPELNAAVMWLMQNGSGHPDADKLIRATESYLSGLPEEGDRDS